jgi:hypothetical protein
MESILEQIPDHFWEDSKWFFEHGDEIIHRYTDQWVAIYNKEVVAVYKDGKWMKLNPELPVDPESCFTFLIEDGARVY